MRQKHLNLKKTAKVIDMIPEAVWCDNYGMLHSPFHVFHTHNPYIIAHIASNSSGQVVVGLSA